MESQDGRCFAEDELLPLSALQHLMFCERQCALIHIEHAWDDNLLTVEGRLMHDRVHERDGETRNDIRIECGLPLQSLRLGVAGQADVVEFTRQVDGTWTPFPIEHKHGKPKSNLCDEVQLCAQAICLEEMTGHAVLAGALFYGKTRRRKDVSFDRTLRDATIVAAQRLHTLIGAGRTPPPEPKQGCRNCSLSGMCMPQLRSFISAAVYIDHLILEEAEQADEETA